MTVPFTDAEAMAFAARLRGRFEEIYPAQWSIDWDRIPCMFKRYGGLPIAWLPEAHRPFLHGDRDDLAGLPEEERLGTLLQCSYGITSVRWYPEGIAKSSPTEPRNIHRDAHYQLRRPTPSGGVTFPGEIYLRYRGTALHGPGLYHYDAARHALVLLSGGDAAAVDAEPVAAELLDTHRWLLIVTSALWKNYFKYADFAYRLSALDTGAVLGQVALVAGRARVPVELRLQFDDATINQALRLDGRTEGAYALIGLGSGPLPPPDEQPSPHGAPMRFRGNEMPPPPDAQAIRMYTACAGRPPTMRRAAARPFPHDEGRTALPPPAPLPSRGLVESFGRTSLGEQFRGTPLHPAVLARLLGELCRGLPNDVLAEGGPHLGYPLTGVIVRAVPGVERGAYFYDPARRELVRVALGDFGPDVQRSMFASYMNLEQVPVCVHLIGSYDFTVDAWGLRGHRIEHVLAGLMTQRLLLAAHALGLSGHPVLGITNPLVEPVYRLAGTGLTPLVTVPVAAVRRAPYLETVTVS